MHHQIDRVVFMKKDAQLHTGSDGVGRLEAIGFRSTQSEVDWSERTGCDVVVG
jgi:hypothetical protein